MTYRFLPHTADVKVAIDGRSFEELLADGVLITRELLAGTRDDQPLSAPGFIFPSLI